MCPLTTLGVNVLVVLTAAEAVVGASETDTTGVGVPATNAAVKADHVPAVVVQLGAIVSVSGST